MATVSKLRKLVNPGRKRRPFSGGSGRLRRPFQNKGKRRKLSPLQKLFFGSKRQRAAVKVRKKRKNPWVVRSKSGKLLSRTKTRKVARYLQKSSGGSIRKVNKGRRRKRNVSSIITIWPKGNPGKKRSYRKRRKTNRSRKSVVVINKGAKMARRRKRAVKNAGRRRRYTRRRSVGVRRYRRHRNPAVKRHTRRRTHRVARRHYRRNPGVLTGTLGRVVGVIGGVAVTKLLMGFVPATFTSGVLGYLATGVVAVAQGKLIGKVSKNSSLGNDFLVGGLAYLAAKILNDFFPSIGSYTGISGMGMIGGSSFYVPQVNQPGSMGSFIVPGAVMGAMPTMAPASGNLGRLRRTGRLM